MKNLKLLTIVFLTILASCSKSDSNNLAPINYTVSTLAGSTEGFMNATIGTEAQFYKPTDVAVDAVGNVYVADYDNHKIRKISPAGAVTTLAGGNQGFLDATGTAAQFNNPYGIALDAAGNVYVADYGNHKIRKITPAGLVTTVAGTTRGFADGAGLTAAKFNNPNGLAVDTAGNVYVADYGNNRIRKISPTGDVSTLAGSDSRGFLDATGTAALFSSPYDVDIDVTGNVYVADYDNRKIRKITPLGVVTTLAGTTPGFADGEGLTAAQFNDPTGVAVDAAGNVYVADYDNHKIRKISPTGAVTTLAGSTSGFLDGTATAAQFSNPNGVALDAAGNVYLVDTGNHRIRKITQD
jgi:sugar lactone lactonase YvrE